MSYYVRVGIIQMLYILISCLAFYGQDFIYVRGEVSDMSDKVSIFLIPSCSNCAIDVLETFKPDSNGKFNISTYKKTKYYLFIEEESPKAYWNAVNYPMGTIRYLPKYRGLLIFDRRAGTIDVGKIKPTIVYLKQEINLSKLIGSADHSDIKIQTKDSKGKIVSSPRTVDEEFWSDRSKLRISFPQGQWILDILVNRNEVAEKVGSIILQ